MTPKTDQVALHVFVSAPLESSFAPVFCGAPKRHDEEDDRHPRDHFGIEELPSSGDDGEINRSVGDLAQGPGGEPAEHDIDEHDEEAGFDADDAADLPVGLFVVMEDDRHDFHGDSAGFHKSSEPDDTADFDDRARGDFEPLAMPDEVLEDEEIRPSPDDGGAEGTSEDVGAEVDEASLPGLDADDGGAFELDDLMRELQKSGLGHESEQDGWSVYEGWGALVSCSEVAIDRGRVVAAGDELLVIDPGTQVARSIALPRRATSVAASPDGAVLGTARGILLAAALARPSNSTTPSVMTLLDTEKPVRSVAIFAGRTWALVGEELWQMGSPPAPPILARSGVLAMTSTSDALVVLTAGPERALQRFRGDDGDWEPLTLAPIAQRVLKSAGVPVVLVSSSLQTLAIASESGVFVSRDNGRRARLIEIDNVAAMALTGPEHAHELLLMVAEPDALGVVMLDEKDRTRLVGRVALPGLASSISERPLRLSVAWDETRDALFVASSSGLHAIGPRRPH